MLKEEEHKYEQVKKYFIAIENSYLKVRPSEVDESYAPKEKKAKFDKMKKRYLPHYLYTKEQI